MTINVTLFSDLHLEFNSDFDPGTGDVLVLAGDICLAKDVTQPAIQRFFSRCVAGYNKVFYVLGNHEFYDHDINKALNAIKYQIPSQIRVLDNNSVYYKGWHWVGATMWSDFLQGNPSVMDDCSHVMNDYHTISCGDRKLTPMDVYKRHHETRERIDQCLPNLNGPVFMITHHQPSLRAVVNTRYDGETRGAYCTELSDFIHKHPNIRYWGCGHVHHNQNYLIGNCNVISNPRGYYPTSLNPDFQPQHMIELRGKVAL